MKRSDIYPPGTEEDARDLPPQIKIWGLHPLVWAALVIFLVAGVGAYSEMIGFYDLDDFNEILSDEETDDGASDDKEVDDSEDASFPTVPENAGTARATD